MRPYRMVFIIIKKMSNFSGLVKALFGNMLYVICVRIQRVQHIWAALLL